MNRLERKSNHILILWRDLVQEVRNGTYPVTGFMGLLDALNEMDTELKAQLESLIEPPAGWEPRCGELWLSVEEGSNETA